MYTFFNNFTGGEISKSMYPRIDLVQRKNGCALLENVLPSVQGGGRRRPGTRFVCRAKYRAFPTRLLPFKYSVDQTYVIELGHLYMRFVTDGGRLEGTAVTVTGADTSTGGLIRITAPAHGRSDGDFVAIRNVLGTTEANDDWEIANSDTDSFDLVDSTFVNPYVSGGTSSEIIEVVSPYSSTQLEEVSFVPDGDLLYLVHPDFPPKVLTRTSATTFTITDLVLIGGPFGDPNLDNTHTMAAAATTGATTLTSSKSYFTAAMVDQLIRVGTTVGGVQGFAKITGFTSATQVNITVQSTLSGTAATATWALGAFGTYSGYPHAVTWFDQRLAFLGTDLQPYSGWLSAVGRQLDFTVGSTASDPVSFSLRSDEVSTILWGVSSNELIVGSTSGEHKITGGNNEPLSPTNGIVRQQTAYGSDPVRPVKMGDLVVHIQRGGERVRAVTFSFDKDSYISNDLTLYAAHLFAKRQVVDVTFQLQPDPILWFTTADGSLRSCTILPDQQVLGYAQHTFVNGAARRCLALPRRASTADETYLLVDRTINGVGVSYIELLDDTLYVDCGISGTIVGGTMAVGGLAHLEGETVAINGDEAVYLPKTVTANTVTFDEEELPATVVQVGLPSVPKLSPMSPEFDTPNGPTFGLMKTYANVQVFTLDTPTVSLNGTASAARHVTDLMDLAVVAEADGVHDFLVYGSATRLYITISQPDPLPFHVVGVYGEVQLGD